MKWDSERYIDRLRRRNCYQIALLEAVTAARAIVAAVGGQFALSAEYCMRGSGLALMGKRARLRRDGKPVPQELEDSIESMLEVE